MFWNGTMQSACSTTDSFVLFHVWFVTVSLFFHTEWITWRFFIDLILFIYQFGLFNQHHGFGFFMFWRILFIVNRECIVLLGMSYSVISPQLTQTEFGLFCFLFLFVMLIFQWLWTFESTSFAYRSGTLHETFFWHERLYMH